MPLPRQTGGVNKEVVLRRPSSNTAIRTDMAVHLGSLKFETYTFKSYITQWLPDERRWTLIVEVNQGQTAYHNHVTERLYQYALQYGTSKESVKANTDEYITTFARKVGNIEKPEDPDKPNGAREARGYHESWR